MKIISYKKIKQNKYEVTLSNNESVLLYDDIILKYELLTKKEIDNQKLKEIILDNSKYDVYYAMLKDISKKFRTEKELRTKFKDYDNEVVDYAVKRLKNEKYLNNELYIRAYINDAINLKLIGPNKIINNLLNLGFEKSEIEEYLEVIDNEIWLDKINKLIKKEINSNHAYSGNVLKMRIQNKISNLGFELNMISKLINNYDFNLSSEKKLKEKEKALKKYSKKYSGFLLEQKVNNYLYQKGLK